MKWFFFLLLLANGALYLWTTNYTPLAGTGTGPALEERNRPALALLGEVESGTDTGEMLNCVRIGPFATEETMARASRQLVNRGYGLTRQKISTREVRNFQVILGPFGSDIARDNARSRLEGQGIDYAPQQGAAGQVLVLRTFARERAAGEFAAGLTGKGFEASVQLAVRTLGPLGWLEVPDVVTQERHDELAAINWGDAMARLQQIPCKEGQ